MTKRSSRQLRQHQDNRLGHSGFEALIELDLSHVLYTHWTDWGTAKTWPQYRRWHAQKG